MNEQSSLRSRFRNGEILLGAIAIVHLRLRYSTENEQWEIGMKIGEDATISRDPAVVRKFDAIGYAAFRTFSHWTKGFAQELQKR